MKFPHTFARAALCLGAFSPFAFAQTPPTGRTPEPVLATPKDPLDNPPLAQAYVRVRPGEKIIEGRTMVPAAFLKNEIGASLETIVPNKQWRFSFFNHTIEIWNGQKGARFDDKQVTLPTAARIVKGNLYVPWLPIAEHLGFRWSRPKTKAAPDGSTLFLLQYRGATIDAIRHSVSDGKIRVVMDLSNATRVTSRISKSGVLLNLSAARRPTVAATTNIGDIAVPRVSTTSGNWKAATQIKLNYAAPVSWYTLSDPPRIVVEVQKIFEQAASQKIGNGISFTRIYRGTGHGPVRMFMATIDPRMGWRVRVAPAGYGVLQRQKISRIASSKKAPLAVNGGFFAYDGAAVGAVKVGNEWIRLPWKGRTAIAFAQNGAAKIGNMQVEAKVDFSSGNSIPIRDLNGWPDKNSVTALTRRFSNFYKLRAGEMAAVIDSGVVVSTPGGGGVNIPLKGFVLVANGGGKPALLKAARKGLRAAMKISSQAWNAYPSALGGGPRLVEDGKAEVKEEGFRSDVTQGLGPRTAMGIDKYGRYIILVADGRQGYYSTGLTLTELAQTMQKYGAASALNLDGGGSTAMVIKGKIVNRPSDGSERRVSNALLVMR